MRIFWCSWVSVTFSWIHWQPSCRISQGRYAAWHLSIPRLCLQIRSKQQSKTVVSGQLRFSNRHFLLSAHVCRSWSSSRVWYPLKWSNDAHHRNAPHYPRGSSSARLPLVSASPQLHLLIHLITELAVCTDYSFQGQAGKETCKYRPFPNCSGFTPSARNIDGSNSCTQISAVEAPTWRMLPATKPLTVLE